MSTNKKKSVTNEKTQKQSNKQKQNKKEKGGASKRLGGLLFLKMARGARHELFSNTERVNRLNVFPVADGDTGDNMRLTIESGIAAIENLDTDNLAHVIRAFSHGMLLGARGNSGVILSQLFAGMAEGLSAEPSADPYAIGRALRMGVERAYTSVLTPTEGTILTVARESVEYATSRLTPHSTVRSLFRDLVSEMHQSLHRTPDLLTVLREAGVVDSGGAGLYYIMDGFYRVLSGAEPSDAPLIDAAPAGVSKETSLTYRYCTEVLLELAADSDPPFSLEKLQGYLSSVGDSVVSAVTDGLLKVHVHTNIPERVITRIHSHGELVRVKVENMAHQHTELVKKAEQPAKKYAIVAVSSSESMREVFASLGADAVIDGGRTGNPSAADFLAAYQTLSASVILVLPNNKNTVLAARQSAELYADADVRVIPTRDVGEGYVALSSVPLDAPSVDVALEAIESAIARITTAYLAPAVRDADLNGVRVKDGDTLGAIGKNIVLSTAHPEQAVTELLDRLLADSVHHTLTAFTGEDCTSEISDTVACYLAEHHPTVEYTVIPAVLPTVTLLFVAE